MENRSRVCRNDFAEAEPSLKESILYSSQCQISAGGRALGTIVSSIDRGPAISDLKVFHTTDSSICL